MLCPVRLSKPSASALRWSRMNGVLAVLALCVALGGLSPSSAQAQKNIDFFTTGSVRSTLVFVEHLMPFVDEVVVVTPRWLAPAFVSPGRLPVATVQASRAPSASLVGAHALRLGSLGPGRPLTPSRTCERLAR